MLAVRLRTKIIFSSQYCIEGEEEVVEKNRLESETERGTPFRHIQKRRSRREGQTNQLRMDFFSARQQESL